NLLTLGEISFGIDCAPRIRPYKNLKIQVVKRKEVKKILDAIYGSIIGGHLGEKAIIQKISKRYHWLQMITEVKNFIKGCEPTQPFDRIGIDFVEPVPYTKKGNKYLIVATKFFTKWPEVHALPNCKAESVVMRNILKSQEKQKIIHDRKYHLLSFSIGSKVWCYRAKLDAQKDIKTHIQRLATALEPDELILLD
ncbi:13850_t:CDS:2, partial [Gigaspora margarita]